MKIGTGLLILTAGAMLLLGGCGHGDTSGRQHEARLFGATYMTCLLYTSKRNPRRI